MRLSTSLRLNAQKGLVTPYDPALTLDLQFAARQAYVANIGPLPTFTRASIGTFVGSDGLIQTATNNVARIDFDPVTRLCRGLLIEEQRTNLQSNSEQLDNAPWVKANTTVTNNNTTAPNGALTADLLVETTANNQHFVVTPSVSITSGTVYTQSVFVKKGSGSTAPDWIHFGFGSGAFGIARAAFNVSTGAFGQITGITSTSVVAYQNGWYRISITATATTTVTSGPALIGFTNNTNTSGVPTYVGQTTSDVFVWGAQFEAGAFATSYIPTTTGSLVRSADVCSITGAAFTGFYNQTEGTLAFIGSKQALQAPGPFPTYTQVSNGTSAERYAMRCNGSGETMFVIDNSTTQVSFSTTIQPANTRFGLSSRYKLNDFAFSLNGAAPSVQVSGTLPTVDRIEIGNGALSNFMGGWIQSIQYYNTIKTNAQLQALSTP
jgi:hypothetical protein